MFTDFQINDTPRTRNIVWKPLTQFERSGRYLTILDRADQICVMLGLVLLVSPYSITHAASNFEDLNRAWFFADSSFRFDHT